MEENFFQEVRDTYEVELSNREKGKTEIKLER